MKKKRKKGRRKIGSRKRKNKSRIRHGKRVRRRK